MQVKLCGMTRAGDAAAAAALGADYVGVIFAGGPRTLTVSQAIEVLRPVRGRVAAVGVFGAERPSVVGEMARAAQLDVVQLHADPSPADVEAVRREFGGRVWGACRVGGATVGDEAAALFGAADGVVLDARVAGAMGGTGRQLPWAALAPGVAALRTRHAALVLAGGLTAANVADAVRLMEPDVVDVSSGVESAPGIKDHREMRAFMDAARAAAEASGSIG